MRTVRPRTTPHPVPTRRSGATRLLRRAAPALTVAVLASLVLGQAPVDPAGQVPNAAAAGPATSAAGATQDVGASAADVVTVAAHRVELKRRKGKVTGDGRTVYVANRTEFRPRRTTVVLPPPVRAKAWVVVDLDTGRVLGANQHRARLPQASTIKLLTALTAVRTIKPGARHRVTRFEARQTCSCVGLKPGAYYDRDALMKGMLLRSGNDAAEAVAGSHPRGRQAFYRAMNRVARNLGARDTVAKNASGLTAWGAHSSARDLVLLLRAAVANPTVRDMLALTSAEVATVNGRFAKTVWRTTDYVNRTPGSLGKSGFTTPAQNTLTVVTEVDGRRIAVASLGAPSGYSTDGARALTAWAADSFTGLAGVGRLPQS